MQRALWRRNASGDRDEDPETNVEAPNRACRLPTAKGIAPEMSSSVVAPLNSSDVV